MSGLAAPTPTSWPRELLVLTHRRHPRPRIRSSRSCRSAQSDTRELMQDVCRQMARLHADLVALRSEVRAAPRLRAETKQAAQTRVGQRTAYRPGPPDGEGLGGRQARPAVACALRVRNARFGPDGHHRYVSR